MPGYEVLRGNHLRIERILSEEDSLEEDEEE